MRIERTKNTVRNIAWGYICKMVNILLPFAFRTVMIKVLGAEYLGVNSLFISILQVLSLSELGFGSAMVFSMYQPIAENNNLYICALLNFYKKIYIVIGCIIMGIGIMITPFIPRLISGSYPVDINIYFVYLMFLINTAISYFLFAYRGSLLNAFQRNDVESKIMIIVSLFRYTLEIIGVYLTHQYYLFLCIEIISTIINNLLRYKFTKKMFPQYIPYGRIDAEKKDEIRNNVMALMCHKIGGIVLNSADSIVLSAFMGVVTVANYSNYYYIMNAVSSIVITCFTGMTAGIGNSFVTEGVSKNRENFKKVLFFNAWIVGWCSTCFLCLYQNFMQIWVGEKYMFSDNIVVLFVIYFFIHSIRRTILVFRDGAGMWQDNKWQPIVSALFNLTVNIILVQIIGVAGILISSIVSMVLIDIPWETNAFCKKLEMRNTQYLSELLFYFIITVFIAGITVIVSMYINYSPILNLLLKGILCIILPNALLFFIFHRKPEYTYFEQLIKKYANKLLKKLV